MVEHCYLYSGTRMDNKGKVTGYERSIRFVDRCVDDKTAKEFREKFSQTKGKTEYSSEFRSFTRFIEIKGYQIVAIGYAKNSRRIVTDVLLEPLLAGVPSGKPGKKGAIPPKLPADEISNIQKEPNYYYGTAEKGAKRNLRMKFSVPFC